MSGWHATPAGKVWRVRRSGSLRALRAGLTAAEAWKLARQLAKRDGATAYLHDADGSVRERVEA